MTFSVFLFQLNVLNSAANIPSLIAFIR